MRAMVLTRMLPSWGRRMGGSSRMKSEPDQAKMSGVGVDDFLFKPFKREDVIDKIERFKKVKAKK